MSVAATTTAAPADTTTTSAADTTTAPAKEPVQATLLPDGEAAPEQTAEPGDKEKPASEAAPIERAAPEKYEFKLPDGQQLDSEVLGKFESVARELKMPQAEAQKVVETMAPVFKAQAEVLLDKQAKAWAAEAKADKEFGGDKLTENLATGERALASFGDDTLRTLLIQTKLANHPAVIRFLVKAGKALSPDTVETGRTDAAGDNSPGAKARRMYPTMEK